MYRYEQIVLFIFIIMELLELERSVTPTARREWTKMSADGILAPLNMWGFQIGRIFS